MTMAIATAFAMATAAATATARAMNVPAAIAIAPSVTSWPRWAVMWALAAAIYAGCKALTWWSTPTRDVPIWRHVGYLLAWPGMDAERFLHGRASVSSRPAAAEWRSAAGCVALGGVLIVGAARRTALPAYVVGWAGMIGLVLILHFGMFHLLSCAWRYLHVQARPLMNHPLASTSVSDFWGRRWNTAFRDLAHRWLFQPLASRCGPRMAVFGVFVFSGTLHDLVISVPAGGGYGGPTLFFVMQAMAMAVERSAFGTRLGLHRGLTGRLFSVLVIAVPIPLLFPRPFVVDVIAPFVRTLGAIAS